MRWRYWRPDYVSFPPSGTVLPARRLNLSHVAAIGEHIEQASMTKTRYKLLAGQPQREIKLDDIADLLDEQLHVHVVLPAPTPPDRPVEQFGTPQPLITVWLNPAGHCLAMAPTLTGVEENIRQALTRLGRPRRSRVGRWATGYAAVFVAALAPLVVLWAMGDLSLWLIPAVVLFAAASFAAGLPLLRARTARLIQEEFGVEFDLRPIRKVRLDQEQKRQRRQTALIYASAAGTIGAVAGAVATTLLS